MKSLLLLMMKDTYIPQLQMILEKLLAQLKQLKLIPLQLQQMKKVILSLPMSILMELKSSLLLMKKELTMLLYLKQMNQV